MPSAGTGPVRFPQRASFVLWVETIWDRDPLHPQRMCLPFIFRRVKTGIAGQQLGRPPQPLLMQAHRFQQQGRVGRPLPAHRIVGNNLILGFLNLHQLAELGRLAHFAFADDFRRRGSNTLTILPGVSVTPRKTRAVVCRSTG